MKTRGLRRGLLDLGSDGSFSLAAHLGMHLAPLAVTDSLPPSGAWEIVSRLTKVPTGELRSARTSINPADE